MNHTDKNIIAGLRVDLRNHSKLGRITIGHTSSPESCDFSWVPSLISTLTSSVVTSLLISFRVFNTVRQGSMSHYLDQLAYSHVLRNIDDVLSRDAFTNITPQGLDVELMVMGTQRDALDDAWQARRGQWEQFVTDEMSQCYARGILVCTQWVPFRFFASEGVELNAPYV